MANDTIEINKCSRQIFPSGYKKIHGIENKENLTLPKKRLLQYIQFCSSLGHVVIGRHF